jgi:hypothetical protein
MKTLTFDTFTALQIEEPVKYTVDTLDAVDSMQRNSKQSMDWHALPVEGAIYGKQKSSLESYCRTKGIRKIYAFFSQLKDIREVFEAFPSAANIQRIEGKCCLRAYTIIPEPGHFQIISDGDYYTIFLGTPEFFLAILGLELDKGIEKFAASILQYSMDRHEKTHLTKILDVCKKFNLKAKR